MRIFFTFLYSIVHFVRILLLCDPPLLLAYLDAHLNEERYYEDWQKIFFELGHIYNKTDGHAEKSLPSYTCARQWLQHHGYDLQKRRVTSGELRNKNVWWVTKQ